MAPRYAPAVNYLTDIPNQEGVEFDVLAFDELVKSQGTMLVHQAAMRCPVGIIDMHDTLRRPHEHHIGCSNGFIYTTVGTLQGCFTGNGLNKKQDSAGNLDSSSATIILPRFYSSELEGDDQRVYIAPFDRLYYADENILVSQWETVEAHASGSDRLQFPPVKVFELMDSRGIRYSGGDFSIGNGNVVWNGQKQPGQDLETGKGVVYSIRYLYRPFYYVSRLLHDIRVTAVTDLNGERQTQMVNKLVSVQREYVYQQNENDPDSATDARQVMGPAEGSLGPK